ncbi:MAG: LytTR family DNA-binding domain-containing protein [Pedobacter sp.]|uniref:LytR/AlgR family response regulator transcription factor n=1 Tax=Pedobacter sp. TaxID=1411316 RepID=UPI002807ED5E|nr:LytTR family DNA-binding domain-containing protein [Pedobacter sp.]MDQ8006261.1 LytTR family DNA-binding domain-containing protein [Pedobacter sp.]
MKEKLNCIIIDDDDLDRMAVEAEVNLFRNLQLIGSFGNPIEALSAMQTTKPDVLFLDIDMPELSGLDFVRRIADLNSINVIISSHPEYALEGFKLNVFDFILKPLETVRFEHTVKRIYDFAQLKDKASAYDVLFENEKIIFKEGHNMMYLNANEVIYLEAYGDYTKIVTDKKDHLTLTTLGSFLELLPEGKFKRIHRSYVVPTSGIAGYGTKTLTLTNGIILPIGKTYLKETKQVFK